MQRKKLKLKKVWWFFWMVLVFGAMLFAGCDDSDSDYDPAKPSPPQQQPVPQPPVEIGETGIRLSEAGTYATGFFDKSAAEIAAYCPSNQRLYVVNGAEAAIDVIDISNPSAPARSTSIDIAPYGAAANSVAVSGGVIAAAVENTDKQAPGSVVFFDSDGNFLKSVPAGPLPDMLTFTPDGKWVIAANEGEPNDDYSVDPEGSVTVIDISGGVSNATARTAGFLQFNPQIDALRAAGVGIYGPSATVAQDLEPEYIAVSPDSKRAWISLQENNAIAFLDIPTARITAIHPLGYKDFSKSGSGMDASNEDGGINIRNWPVYGLYQPDAIAAYSTGGETYLITANEGDSRDYDAFSEEERIADVVLDPDAFPNAAELQDEANLGRLKITLTRGDEDGDGDFDALYAYGARSFTIWKPTRAGLERVFDSGDAFERIIAAKMPALFNATNDENEADDRSDDKGPEPEGVTIGTVNGRTYAFIGLERVGGIMVYDVTDPVSPMFVEYVNNRNPAGDPEAGTAGDLGPEGLVFIPQGPGNSPMFAAANEVSGSTTLYTVETVPLFPLTLMHLNDTHSNLEEMKESLDLNGLETDVTLGGYPRLISRIREVRAQEENTLMLHAGDALQGTLYYTRYDGEADLELLNPMGIDAMTLGNHEFDKGPAELASFIQGAQFPIIGANVDASAESRLAGQIPGTVIHDFNGQQVAVIGIATPNTPSISSPGPKVKFLDPAATVSAEIDRLSAQGIDKIIVLSHMGYAEDLELAETVAGIDVIVGGHSHTLLGDLSEVGKTSEGPYPTLIYGPSGQRVCVVQAWRWGLVLGELSVGFGPDGDIIRSGGNPVLLLGENFQREDENGESVTVEGAPRTAILEAIAASSVMALVPEDAGALAALETYKSGVEALTKTQIATVSEALYHERIPGSTDESGQVLENGSLIAPIVAQSYLRKLNENGLDVDMTVQSAGGVRIDVPEGPFTVGTAYTILPFGSTLVVLELTGAEIRQALEDAVERILNIHNGAFPYVAGARYTADISRPFGQRIVRLDIMTGGGWAPVQANAVYRVGTNSYMASGGDDYQVFAAATDRGDAYDTGFVDAEALMEYAEYKGTLDRPESTGITYVTGTGSTITLRVIETTDVHGALFPYDFIEDTEVDNSLAQIYSYVQEQRNDPDQSVILLDGGDILQGQPIVNYYNFEKDPAQGGHIVADVMNYIGYDAAVVGNHDIEPGPGIYNAIAAQFEFPWLSANTLRTPDGSPYFQPYTVIERQGLRIAVLGLTTPGIPNWLPQSVWEGMEFQDMIEAAQYWVPRIQETEKPDLLIGLFHSGYDYTYGEKTADTPKNENASQLVAQQVPGFDLICMGHDHMDHVEWVNGTLIIGASSNASQVAVATLRLTPDGSGGYTKEITGEVVDPTTYPADPDMMAHFSEAIEETKAYAGERIGSFAATTSSRESMFGDSSFVDLIHELQFSVAENHLGQKPEVSFAAPLQFDKTIYAGPVYVRDMYKLYRYENFLYLMELTGEEIRNFLEYSYDIWMNRMVDGTDHLLNFDEYDESTGNYDLAARYYNYDSAAGIVYTVDLSQPKGMRVTVEGMDADLDGRVDPAEAFDPEKTYTVAINSYRGGGGGGHLLGAGLTQAEIDAESRKTAQTERDLRHYLIQEIREDGTVTPRAIGNWKVIPEAWAAAGADRDYEILYGPMTFAVFSDPHLFDPAMGTEGPAFEAYLMRDRKLIRESRAILDAALAEIKNEPGVEFVLIPGDLTKDGERSSHEMFAEILRSLESEGIRAYVVPGNHDVNNPHAYAYAGEQTIEADTVTPEEFASIYSAFGYEEALYRDSDSLSYIAEPSPGVWLFALDSTNHDENDALGKPVTSGRFTQATLGWIVEKLGEAEAKGKQVIAMMHHGLLEHFTGQSQMDPGSEYVIEDWENVSRTLAGAGLNIVFTGHFHSQDVTGKSWQIDGETATLVDLETGSLVTWPNPYRVAKLDKGGQLVVDSGYVTEVDYDTGALSFPEYAAAYLEEGLYTITLVILTAPADHGGFGLPQAQAEALAPMIVDAYSAHYAGDESPSQETQAAIQAYMGSDDPVMQVLGQSLYSLWTDLPPADTAVSIGTETARFNGM